MDLGTRAAGIGALADDTRRALYEYVVAQSEAVGREEAATAVGVAQHKANFHLDRLVDEGLLDVEYRRLSGKSGPGAGRPSKLYRRAKREFAVSLPPRHYNLVGDILAIALDRAIDGEPIDAVIASVALEEGREVGAAASRMDVSEPLEAVARVLAVHGYEPRVDDGVVVLRNCPFDYLAQKHTGLVCGLNKDFIQGVTEGLGCPQVTSSLEPAKECCCVKVRTAGDAGAGDAEPR